MSVGKLDAANQVFKFIGQVIKKEGDNVRLPPAATRPRAAPQPAADAAKARNKPPSPAVEAEGRAHSIIERPGTQSQYTTHNADGTWKQYRGSGQDHGAIPRPNVKEPTFNTNPKTGQKYQNGTVIRRPHENEYP